MQLDTLTLPDNFVWVNEFDWSPVEQAVEHSLTGALVVSESQKVHGRSIILGDGENSWLTREQLEALFLLSAPLYYQMPLILADGQRFTVIFDRREGGPLIATPILSSVTPKSTDFYAVVIRLLTVAPEP